MQLTYFSLGMAALVPASQALLLKDSFDFVYEAQVEHRFLPWAKQKVAKEIVDKDSTYTKDFNSIENSNKAGFTVGLEAVELGSEFELSWKNVRETETKVENFHSEKTQQETEYQPDTRMVVRVAQLKTCLNKKCNSKKVEEVVEYVEKGAVQDSVRQYWKEQSYEYLNTHLLPNGVAPLPKRNTGYAVYKAAAKINSYRYVNKYWKSGWHSENLVCKDGEIITGMCGSGAGSDCYDHKKKKWMYGMIECSDEVTNLNLQSDGWFGDEGNYPSDLHYCPPHQPFLTGFCGAGYHPTCNKMYGYGRCSSKLGLGLQVPTRAERRRHGDKMGWVNNNCKWIGGGWGKKLTCPDKQAGAGFCGSGKWPHCANKSLHNAILCCKYD